MKKISEQQKKKSRETAIINRDKKEIEKQELISKIQEESKNILLPELKKKMEETTELIVDLLKDKDLNNIQIMSMIAKRSVIDIANVGNISYTPQEILAGFNLYLEMINKINNIKTFPPTVESFCAFIGISRTTYNSWLVDYEKKGVMEYIHSYLLGVLATGGLTGEFKEISSMFLQKTMGKVEQATPMVVKHEVTTNIDDIKSQLSALKRENIIDAEFEEKTNTP